MIENRLLTIVFIDMQGYTRRSAGQTIEEMKLFHDQMFAFVSEIMQKWDGIMVKTMGDGFMVRFDSPTNAVQAGIEIQRRLESRNAQMMNPDSIVRFRIGINTGEVGIDEQGDLFGDPVNIASRIQTFADPSDVFISESTYLAMNRNEFGAVDLGSQELKNATREIKIYKILKDGRPGIVLPSGKSAGHQEPSVSLVSRHLRLIVVVVVIISLILTVFVLLKRRGRHPENPGSEPAGLQSVTQVPVEQPNSSGASQLQTLLEVDPRQPRLPLNEPGRKALADIQKAKADGNLEKARRIARAMLEDKGQQIKLVWALVMAELFWLDNDRASAEKIFSDILKREGKMPENVKKNLLAQIELIRRR